MRLSSLPLRVFSLQAPPAKVLEQARKALKAAAMGMLNHCGRTGVARQNIACVATVMLAAIFFVDVVNAQVAEPADYKLDNFRSRVPERLSGAKTVSTLEAWRLWQAGGVPFIDVMPQAPKPKKLAKGVFWLDKTRDNIPGSFWLANVGYGLLHPDVDRWFRSRLALVTAGRKDKPILFYCLMNCWMSWNAAKRALEYGYSNVIWYPDGSDGWAFENYPLKASYPEFPQTPEAELATAR